MALLEKAAGQGHAYAMFWLGQTHAKWEEHEQAMEWFTKAAETGLPNAMFKLGCLLDRGGGTAAPDYPAAAHWLRRAADAGVGAAASNLANMYTLGRGRAWQTMPASSFFHISDPCFLSSLASRDATSFICLALGRGVTRSKGRAMQWMRRAADMGFAASCTYLARSMYTDHPYAREVGLVGRGSHSSTSQLNLSFF